jgi:hypothetical protein
MKQKESKETLQLSQTFETRLRQSPPPRASLKVELTRLNEMRPAG